jgi:serine/threonine protein kinase
MREAAPLVLATIRLPCRWCGVAGAQSAGRRVGTGESLLEDFTLGKMIGRGTYGEVFEAWTTPPAVKVAVKTIHKQVSRMRHVASELDTLVAVSGKHATLPTGAFTRERENGVPRPLT